MDLVLHFDGGCWPNPGGVTRYGWHLDTAEGVRVADSSGVYPAEGEARTNNTAEWAALEAGLRWLSKLRLPINTLLILGDSQLVVRQFKGEWKCKKPWLLEFRESCRELLGGLDVGHVSVEWRPREENAEADALTRSPSEG
jgi:ribonuclease HI